MSIQVKKVNRTSNLIGIPVKNSRGEDLGKVHEMVIDVDDGRIAYMVISFGGIVGTGKLFGVPWELTSLRFGEVDKYIVVDVPRETLHNSPGFDKDNWPDELQPTSILGADRFGRVPAEEVAERRALDEQRTVEAQGAAT